MRQKRTVFLTVVGCLLFSFLSSQAQANIVIKVRALNPLETQEVASISYPLPEEVTPEDILDKKITFSLPPEEGQERKTTFNVEYKEDQGRYFIVDEIELGPREVVTLEVHVKDIWMIPQERLDGIKKTVEDLIAQQAPGEEPPEENPSGEEAQPGESPDANDEDTVIILQDQISEEIDAIAARQQKSSVLKVGVESHMEAYYENMEALAQVEADVGMLRYLLEPEEEDAEEEGAAEAKDLKEELPTEKAASSDDQAQGRPQDEAGAPESNIDE